MTSPLSDTASLRHAPTPRKTLRASPADAARREIERHRFLRGLGVLDTAPEPFTDAVVDAAAMIANTPFAAISLLDEHRQWFKGACGFDQPETARDISFCTHAIETASPLIVQDARLDPRFMQNPSVTGDSRICFYAGFPLVIKGFSVGALCVLDDHPRHLTGLQVERLAALAAGTAAWLATRGRDGSR
jgi:GAF domain-containing protein